MGIRPEHQELMQREIDGDLSEAERPELLKVLEQDPEARQEFENLKEVAETLSKTPALVPPADLKRTVMAAVVSNRSPAGERRRGLLGFPLPAVFRYGYAAAVGLVIGVLIAPLAGWFSGPDSSDALGTLARTTEKPMEHVLNFEGGRGTLLVEKERGGYSVTLDLELDRRIRVAVAIGESRELRGFRRISGHSDEFEAGRGVVSWYQEGRGAVRLNLTARAEDSEPLTVEIGSGDGSQLFSF